MMANFDTPVIENLTSIFTYSNTITDGWFGYSILIMAFVISFVAMIKWRSDDALISSLFLTTVIAVFLFVAGLIQAFGIIYPLLGLIGIAVVKVVS